MRSGAALRRPRALPPRRALAPRWGHDLRVPAILLLGFLGILWAAGVLPQHGGRHATSSTSPVGAHPSIVTLPLGPGSVATTSTNIITLRVPPLVDIVLVQDETGSFRTAIDTLKTLVSSKIVPALNGTGASYRTGVVGFRDYGHSPWGDSGDWVYRELAPLEPSGTGFANGVPALSAAGGNDTPEAQLEALAYLADPVHSAIDSNGDGEIASGNGDTPAGEQPRWRVGARRVVLLATDAACHTVGDGTGWPGDSAITSITEVARQLVASRITVIGIAPPGADLTCVTALATATGGTVQRTNESASDIAQAILAGLQALPVTVTPVAHCSAGVRVRFDPPQRAVRSGGTVRFHETFARASDAPPGPASCGISYLVNGKVSKGFQQRVTLAVPRREAVRHAAKGG